MNYIFAPHLDDEIIGCYSVFDTIDVVVYFTKDYREKIVLNVLEKNKEKKLPKYIYKDDFDFSILKKEDNLYLPSKYDFHPLHKKVRNEFIILPCNKFFYSIEMNVPWLEEEENSLAKLKMLQEFYPDEDLFLTNAKYYLFKSIKEWDYIVFKDFKVEEYKIKIQEIDEEIFRFDLISLYSFIDTPEDFYNKIQNRFPKSIIELKFNNQIIK